MKIYTRILIMSLFIFLFYGCEKDFDEINKDPNAVTEVIPDFLLPGSVMSISNIENAYMESFAYASDWVQFTSSGTWPDPGQYYFEKSRASMWDMMYTGPLVDLYSMNALAAKENNNSLRAVSDIMYCYGYAMLTDAFGPIPFSQALKADESINKPEYDSQQDIYIALLDSLANANTLLSGITTLDIDNDYDVVYAGDAMKWRKFCNGLRLRLLMRISGVIDVQEEIRNLLSDPECPLPESIDDDAAFEYPGTSPINYFPLYDILSESATDGGYRISKTLMDQLKNDEDPRLTVYALPNKDGEYVGLENGVATTGGAIDDYSRINFNFGVKNRKGIFLSYSEVQFLLAEAAARNIIADDPENFYQEAIHANFRNLNIDNAEFQAFIESPAGSYTGLNRVLMQKWISLFGRGMEAWTEYRRTGIPELAPASNGFIDEVPKRFLYPITEEQTNNNNLQQAISSLNNGDALNSRVWWMN